MLCTSTFNMFIFFCFEHVPCANWKLMKIKCTASCKHCNVRISIFLNLKPLLTLYLACAYWKMIMVNLKNDLVLTLQSACTCCNNIMKRCSHPDMCQIFHPLEIYMLFYYSVGTCGYFFTVVLLIHVYLDIQIQNYLFTVTIFLTQILTATLA